MLDGQTLMLIFVAILLLFGTSKLPELARSLGQATGEFKKAQIETAAEVRKLEIEQPKDTKKNVSQNIIKLATDLGIKTEGKDENMILEEIKLLANLKIK